MCEDTKTAASRVVAIRNGTCLEDTALNSCTTPSCQQLGEDTPTFEFNRAANPPPVCPPRLAGHGLAGLHRLAIAAGLRLRHSGIRDKPRGAIDCMRIDSAVGGETLEE